MSITVGLLVSLQSIFEKGNTFSINACYHSVILISVEKINQALYFRPNLDYRWMYNTQSIYFSTFFSHVFLYVYFYLFGHMMSHNICCYPTSTFVCKVRIDSKNALYVFVGKNVYSFGMYFAD